MTDKDELTARGISATTAYLDRIGAMVLLNKGTGSILAMDGPVFVQVQVITTISIEDLDRQKAKTPPFVNRVEELSDFMYENDLVGDIRLDDVIIRQISDNRALLRHHRDIVHTEGES